MKAGKLVFSAQSLMEIAWLYAIISFVTTATIGRPLAFVVSVCCFYGSTIVVRLVFKKGFRNLTVLVIQVAAFVFMAFVVLHIFFYRSSPLFDKTWLDTLFSRHSPREVFNLVIVLLSVSCLWGAGIALAMRKMEYRKIAGRFDIGLVVFFCLFLLKVALKVKGGIVIEENASILCMFIFLSTSLPAIGMARLGEEKSRTYLPGYGLLGMFVSFIGIVFFAGTVTVVFFATLLRRTADAGYQAIQTGAMGLFSIISPILRYLYLPRNMLPEPAEASAKAARLHDAAMPTSWWGKALYQIVDMGLKGFIIALVIAVAAFFVYCTISWLLKRKPVEKQKARRTPEEELWYRRFWSALRALWRALQRMVKGHTTAIDVYASLVRWGRLSGVTPSVSQTPSEFTSRLVASFPALESDLRLILAAYNAEAYGRATTVAGRMAALRTALRNVKHPRYWATRARVRMMGCQAAIPRQHAERLYLPASR